MSFGWLRNENDILSSCYLIVIKLQQFCYCSPHRTYKSRHCLFRNCFSTKSSSFVSQALALLQRRPCATSKLFFLNVGQCFNSLIMKEGETQGIVSVTTYCFSVLFTLLLTTSGLLSKATKTHLKLIESDQPFINSYL